MKRDHTEEGPLDIYRRCALGNEFIISCGRSAGSSATLTHADRVTTRAPKGRPWQRCFSHLVAYLYCRTSVQQSNVSTDGANTTLVVYIACHKRSWNLVTNNVTPGKRGTPAFNCRIASRQTTHRPLNQNSPIRRGNRRNGGSSPNRRKNPYALKGRNPSCSVEGASRSNLLRAELFYGTVQLIRRTARAGPKDKRRRAPVGGCSSTLSDRAVHIADCKPHSNFNLNERGHKFPDGNIMRGDFNG